MTMIDQESSTALHRDAEAVAGPHTARKKSRAPSAGDLWLPLSDFWAIGEDDLQWIVYRRARKKDGSFGAWRPVKFFTSRDLILERLPRLVYGDRQADHAALEVIATWPAVHPDLRIRR